MDLSELEKILSYTFKKKDLLRKSLSHRSILSENNKLESNERLEFLGDAVLELVVTKFLFRNYPQFDEGKLTSIRSALVKTESLFIEAKKLNLGKFIIMSSGEESTGGRSRPYILANTFEAIIGAIFLDSNLSKVNVIIERLLIYKVNDIIEKNLDVDSKSKFQELIQEKFKFTPKYTLLKSKGPDHEKYFEMALIIDDLEIAKGFGSSKQSAEKMAAEVALKNWNEVQKKLSKKNF